MKIFRKRFIPNEVVDISEDEVLHMDEELIVTKWLPINPRGDIGSGISYSFIREGFKISKFFNTEGNFKCWYCDIIDYQYDNQNDEHTFIDLLVDVKADENWNYEVLDLDELAMAYKMDLITADILCDSLEKLNKLLAKIKSGELQKIIEKYDG